MVDRFSVQPSELLDAAAALRDLTERVTQSPGTRYEVRADQVGSDRLAAAVAEAQQASRHSLEVLSDTAREAADRLHDSATAYAETDHALADATQFGADAS